MKTFSGQFYPSYFSPPSEATLLLSDRILSIGFHDQDGNPATQDWSIKEVQGDFLFAEQRSRFIQVHTQAEFRVAGREAFEYWEEIKAESARSWFRKKKTGNLRRTKRKTPWLPVFLMIFLMPWPLKPIILFVLL